MIIDVQNIPLKQIADERGKIMHMLRCDDVHFEKFGEVYFSWVNPCMIKGWHKKMYATTNYAVPIGCTKVVIYDDRQESKTFGNIQEYILNPENYSLLIIPPKVWYGFQGIGKEPAMIVNCSSLPHDPNASERLDPYTPKIPYKWSDPHAEFPIS